MWWGVGQRLGGRWVCGLGDGWSLTHDDAVLAKNAGKKRRSRAYRSAAWIGLILLLPRLDGPSVDVL